MAATLKDKNVKKFQCYMDDIMGIKPGISRMSESNIGMIGDYQVKVNDTKE